MRKIIALFWIGVLMAFSTTLSAAVTYCAPSAFGYGQSATGGGSVTPVLVSSVSQLQSALNKGKNKVIIITQNLTFTSCLKVQDGENVTLMGLPGVTLTSLQQNKDNSGILYVKRFNNLIIRNLTFVGPGAYDCNGWDLLCFEGVTNAWVDHCDFQDGCDGNFDNKGNTDNVTVSWCRFRYLKAPKSGGETDDHRFTNLLGSSASDKPSDGTFNFTWAYCWWDEGCVERMTRCRNCEQHFINCYWNSSVSKCYIGPENAKCYFEGCTFAGKANTSKLIYKSYNGTTNACKFVNCSGNLPSNTGTVSDPSFSYALFATPAAAVTAVTNASCGAGATLTVTTAGAVSSACDGGAPAPTVYTVTWNATTNGGSCGTATTMVTDGNAIGSLPEATKTSFNFDGWYTAPSGGTKITSSTIITGNVTYYAQFTSVPVTTYYTIIWDANGGSCGTASTSVESGHAISTAIASLPTATKAGDYTFDGWYTAVSGGTKITTSTVINANVTYYAHYNATGGGGGSGDCYEWAGSPSSLTDGSLTANTNLRLTAGAGASIDNAAVWSGSGNKVIFKIDGSAKYVEGHLIDNSDITSVTISAATNQSSAKIYAIVFSPNSAFTSGLTIDTHSAPSASAAKDESNLVHEFMAPSGTKYFRVYRKFTYDATDYGDNQTIRVYGVEACSGSSSAPTPTFALYYDENGGSGTMAETEQTGANVTVAANAYTAPTGYAFQEWNASMSSGGTVYTAGQVLTLTEDLTIYAIWQAQSYTVTLDAAGGTGGSTSVEATFDEAMPSIAVPTKVGYVFSGYFTGTNGTGTQYYDGNGSSTNSWDIAADTELHAYWVEGSSAPTAGCDLHFWFFKAADAEANGKTNDATVFSGMVTNSSSLSGSITIDGTSYSVTGRTGDPTTFGSFTIPAGKTGIFYALAVSSGGGDRQIILNDGTTDYELDVAGGSDSYKRIESDELPEGTYSIGKGGGNVRLGVVVVKLCETTPPVDYTITHTAASNGTYTIQVGSGSAVSTNTTAHYNQVITLAATPSSGYELSSWTVTKEGGGTVPVVSNQFTMPEDNVTITATFTEIVVYPGYTVTYNANGGSVTPASRTQASEGASITLDTPTRTDYTFLGWYVGATKIGEGGDSYVPTADVTAIAAWKQDCAGGGGGSTIYSTDVIASPASPVTSVSSDKGSFEASATTWSSPYTKYFLTSGSAGYYQLNFSTPLSLDGYTSPTITVYWGASSNRPLNLSINGGSATKIDEVTSSSDRNKLRSIEAALSETSISSIKLVSSGGGGVYLFRIEITDGSSSGSTCYYVTYDGNGANGGYTNDPTAYSNNAEVTVLANSFTKTGYVFQGWAATTAHRDAGTVDYNPAGTFNITANTTLYAVWALPCATPAAPTGFATTEVASTTATFSITDAADAASYDLYYASGSPATPDAGTAATANVTTKTPTISGLTSGATYYAWVRAVCDADNKSAWVALSGSSFTTGKTQPNLYTVAASAEGECAGGMTVKVTLSGSQTGIDYQLKNNGSNDGAAKAGTGSALEWTGKSSGVYTIWAVENATYSGRQMSKTVTVEIYDATAITTQPATSVSAETSESFTLGSGMVAAGHELTYRWYTCSSTGTDTAFISGATAATYATSQAVANTYYYRVRVAGTCGDPVLSDVITVTVSAPASASAAPTISVQPAGATYCAGDAITDLSITASGSGTVTYQWKKDGVDIPSATGATYAPSAAGTYVCVVTNTEDGKSPTSLNSNEAVITINAAVVAPTMSQTENTVSLATVTDGATIYYTTDGTDPTTSSASGTSVTIVADCTVKAYAVKDGCESSIESFAATYVVVCPKWVGTPSSWTDSKITVGLLELETNDASKTAISSNAVWSGHNETVTAISGSNVYIQGHLTDGAELGTITISAANNQSSGDYEYVIIFCANSSFSSGVTGQTWAAPSYTDAQDDAKLVHSFTAPVGAKYFRIYRKVDAIGGYAGGGDGKTTRIYRIESCPAETFEVTYKANGGTGADVVEDTRVVGDVPGSFTAPSGKVFDHWDTAPDDGGVDYDPGDAVTSDLTLYAQWVVETFTLTNEVSPAGYGAVDVASVGSIPSGTATSITDNTYTVNGTTVTATPAAATAEYTYAFDSWSGIPASVTANATVTANFRRTPNAYTVMLDANGGTINSGNVTSYTYGVGATLPTDVTKTGGYDFAGWYDNSGLTGSPVTTIATNATGNKAYWAKWILCPVANSGDAVYKFVTKSSGLGTGNVCAATNTDYDLTTPSPLSILTGGTLTGRGTGSLTQLSYHNDCFSFSSGTNVWLKVTLDCPIADGDIIRFVNNNSGSIYVRHTSKSTSDDQITLQGNSTTNVQTIAIPAAFVGETELYLVRNSNTSYISYFEILRSCPLTLDAGTNGGTVGGAGTQVMRVAKGDVVALPHAFKEGYAFAGWFTAPSGGSPVSNPYTITGATTLYAQFEDCPHDGTMYKFEVGTGLTNGAVTANDVAFEFTTANYLSSIVGGTLTTAGSKASKVTISGTNAITITDNAAYLRIDLDCEIQAGDVFKSTVSGNTVYVSKATSRTKTVELPIGTLTQTPIPTSLVGAKTLYIWKGSGDSNALTYFEITRPKQTNITLNATGAYNHYTTSIVAMYEQAMPEIAILPLRTGYVFGGYYDAPDGAGTQYYNGLGASVHNWDKDVVSATLYAKWSEPCDLTPTLTKTVPVATIWDGQKVDMALVQLSCDFDATGITYSLASWSEAIPGCTFAYFDERIYIQGTPALGNASTVEKTITFTMTNDCSSAPTYNVTATIRIYPASQKAKIAYIIRGTKGGGFNEYNTSDESNSSALLSYLRTFYEVDCVNGYATKDEAAIAAHYDQYDLLIVTDYMETPEGYTNAIGTLIDKKPILSFEAYVAGEHGSNWHIGSNPKDPSPKVQDMKILCAGHAIFKDAEGVDVINDADTTVHVLSSLSSASDAKGLQGFVINEAPDYIFLATVRDANHKRDLIVCCERQVVFPARLLLYGINYYEMGNLSPAGKVVMHQMIDYLLMTDETKVADCSLVFDNGAGNTSFDPGAYSGTGTRGDGKWSTAANWFPGYNIVPTPYHPTRIIAECHVDVDNAHAGSVKVNKGRDEHGDPVDGKVIVEPYGGLTVAGMVMKVNDTRYASPITIKAEDLLIKADATHNGAFVYGNKESDVRATVQYYSCAEGANTTNPIWQYIGIPFQAGQTAIGLYYEAWMCRWSSASDGSMGGLWQWVNNEDVLVPFEGYCITQEAKKTYTFAGKLNAPVTTAISLDNRDDDGYAFAANSWTAPIKIQEMADDDFVNAERAIYIYHTGSYAQWGTSGEPVDAASGSAATLPGQYAVVPIHSSPYLTGADSVIPSMQGFFVKTTPGEDAELKLVYNRTVYDATYFKTSTQPMRAPRRVKTEGPIVMRLMVSGAASGGDQVHLLARSDFSEQFEDGWDGRKLEGDAAAPKLAVVKEAGEMAVAAIPTAEERFLSFRAGEDTEYTFSFAYEGETLYLYDVLTQEATLIRTGNTYTFTADNKTAINRFMITAHPPKLPTDVENTEYNAQNAEVKKLIIEDHVYILRGNGVYDVTGRRVAPFAGKEEAQ